MRHSELIILGIISVVIVLVVQATLSIVFLNVLGFSSFDFSYATEGSSLIVAVIIAALIEEMVRIAVLFGYIKQKMTAAPERLWTYGLSFGLAFGLSEALLRLPDIDTWQGYLGISCTTALHTILSILAILLLRRFSYNRLILTLVFLTVIHVNYNLFILYILPVLDLS